MAHILAASLVSSGVEIHYRARRDGERENKLDTYRTIVIPRGQDYDAEIADVEDALQRLLSDAIDDSENPHLLTLEESRAKAPTFDDGEPTLPDPGRRGTIWDA